MSSLRTHCQPNRRFGYMRGSERAAQAQSQPAVVGVLAGWRAGPVAVYDDCRCVYTQIFYSCFYSMDKKLFMIFFARVVCS